MSPAGAARLGGGGVALAETQAGAWRPQALGAALPRALVAVGTGVQWRAVLTQAALLGSWVCACVCVFRFLGTGLT